jgi:hypothetical protein
MLDIRNGPVLVGGSEEFIDIGKTFLLFQLLNLTPFSRSALELFKFKLKHLRKLDNPTNV